MTIFPDLVLKRQKGFYLAASHRQIKKSLLCVLGVSAVRFLFWTRMTFAIQDLKASWKWYRIAFGALQVSPWFPKTIPTYAKASVGHPPVSEIRRSMID